MQPPSFDEQICCVRRNLESQSFDGLVVYDQVSWLGLIVKKDKKCPTEFVSQWETLNALLVHASRCRDYSLLEGETVESRHEPMHAWQQLCHYPKCERGKVLYRHISACRRSACLLCQSMRHLVKFHSETCSDSNCRIPRCSEMKEKRQRRLIKNQLRLEGLRRNEMRLRQLYMPESLPAAAKVTESNASADYCALQLGQLSVQEGKGDRSNHNDENKLLGDQSSVSSFLASGKEEEQKEGRMC